MVRCAGRWLPIVVGAVIFLSAHTASAQVIGTFRWQQQPYCNVLTLNVVASGNVFHLDGVDDQCGAPTGAAVSGLAFLNPNGTIGLGLTIVTTPGGAPTHLDATISVSTVSGTWRDAAGDSGPWTFQPGPSSGGVPRPALRPVFTQGLSAGNAPISNVGAPASPSDAAHKAYVDNGNAADGAYANGLAVASVPSAAMQQKWC